MWCFGFRGCSKGHLRDAIKNLHPSHPNFSNPEASVLNLKPSPCALNPQPSPLALKPCKRAGLSLGSGCGVAGVGLGAIYNLDFEEEAKHNEKPVLSAPFTRLPGALSHHHTFKTQNPTL